MSFRLRLPNQIDGLLCTARRITGLTSTKGLGYLLHLLIRPAVLENVVDPLQKFSGGGYLGDLSSFPSFNLKVKTPEWPWPFDGMYCHLD